MSAPLSDVIVGIFGLTLSLSPFYIFAGMGEIVAEKSGVANMGIEGIMLMSLFTTIAVDLITGNPWLGILAALGTAGVIGLFFAFCVVEIKLDQIVFGLAIYLFGLGMSFVLANNFKSSATPVNLQPIHIPVLSGIPILGPILFRQNILVYFSIVFVVLIAYFLDRTSLGLRVRAVGENPKASDNMGVNVQKVRFLATLFGCLLAGFSGAYFFVGFLQSFQFDIIEGRGFIVLAMVYLANYKPYRMMLAAFLFNIVYVLQSEYVATASSAVAGVSQLFNMLPYVFLLAMIPILGRGSRPPKYLLKPYRKG